MRKSKDVARLARGHTDTAIKVLAGLMNSREVPPAARIAAAGVLLDRGHGKAALTLAGSGVGSIKIQLVDLSGTVVSIADGSGTPILSPTQPQPLPVIGQGTMEPETEPDSAVQGRLADQEQTVNKG